jgi:hypothetical protein
VDEAQRLIAKAERLAAAGERIGAAFARELAKVWRDADREIRRLLEAAEAGSKTAAISAVRAIALKDQIREVLRGAGYDRVVAAATAVGVEAMVTASRVGELIADITPQIEALRRITAFDLFSKGDEVSAALWRSVVQHLWSGRPVADILADLGDVLDAHDAEVRTLYDTAVSMFGRQVEAVQTEDLGEDQPFLFSGPIDDVTRPFCLERVGRIYTRAEIDEMDNEQIGNVFLTGGGFNCRHAWLAVESAELRGMVGTEQRIPEVADDIERIRARKAEKRRKAA